MGQFAGWVGRRGCCWTLCLMACGGRVGQDAEGTRDEGGTTGGQSFAGSVGTSGASGLDEAVTGGANGSSGGTGNASGSSLISTGSGGMSLISIERVTVPPCGNGRVEASEACDDGNTLSGDGCSAKCQLDDPVCPSSGCLVRSVCGDGRRDSTEICDDANVTSGDGCDATCSTQEDGWLCAVPGRRCTSICGDARVVGAEDCDVGAQNGMFVAGSSEGCSRDCRSVPSCMLEGSPAACPELCANPSNKPAYCPGLCGDGIKDWNEQCDPGPDYGGSLYGACTASCQFGSYCGDGVLDVENGEECDWGMSNADPYGTPEGCSRDCRRAHYCGDGIVDSLFGEQCDVGTLGDGRGVFGGCIVDDCRIWLP